MDDEEGHHMWCVRERERERNKDRDMHHMWCMRRDE